MVIIAPLSFFTLLFGHDHIIDIMVRNVKSGGINHAVPEAAKA